MSYRDFTIKDVKQKLGLTLIEDQPLHEGVEEVAPGPRLAEWLQDNATLALDINTEKARSEMIIAPIPARGPPASTTAGGLLLGARAARRSGARADRRV